MGDTPLESKKVIIIEDDPLLHNLLKDKLGQLREKGLDIHPVKNGEEGLVRAREVHPDLIMLDLVLPGMSGFDFLARLRKESGLEKTSVAVLSNLSDDADKEKARKLGVTAYLVKADFSLTEVSAAIEELLHGKPPPSPDPSVPDVQKTAKGNMIYL